MAGTGTGQPITFVCPVARRRQEVDPTARRYARSYRASLRYPPGHTRITRTGRVKNAAEPGRHAHAGSRVLNESHEYVCECGHRGWSKHRDILHYPIEGTGPVYGPPVPRFPRCPKCGTATHGDPAYPRALRPGPANWCPECGGRVTPTWEYR